MKNKLFRRDFTMVVVGQIISLFGNNILRYALPLYLLNKTGSAALYGTVMALSVLPMLALAPVGGIIADRVNKRDVMVCLDFFTSALMLFYTFSFERLSLVPLLIAVLMLLYGIQGAYQPAVQASLPVLTAPENLMAGNGVINAVNSLAGVVGPVLGGVIFGFYGVKPILIISVICFFFSAVMEIFIHIPFEKRQKQGGIFTVAIGDMKESWRFVSRTRPEILRVGLLLAVINMAFSALVIVGLPIVVTGHLGFSLSAGNRLYGYAEGVLAAGGLLGGLLSGVVGTKLRVSRGARLIFWCTATLLPIGLVLLLPVNGIAAYLVIVCACFAMMIFSTIFSIEMISYVQKITPSTLTGKVMALLTCLVMLGSPVGQVVYGQLFESLSSSVWVIFLGALMVCAGLCVVSHYIFRGLSDSVITAAE